MEIQVTTSIGEVKFFKFDDFKAALDFFSDLDEIKILNTDDSPTLMDNLEEVKFDEE